MIKKKIIENIFKIHRSLAGSGNRKTIKILSNQASKKIKLKHFKSGKSYNGWKIPNEWNVKEAFISHKNKKIIDFKNNNLHIIPNSVSVDKFLNLKILKRKYLQLKIILMPYHILRITIVKISGDFQCNIIN